MIDLQTPKNVDPEYTCGQDTNARFLAPLFGLGAVGLFVISYLILAVLNPEFDWLRDHISKLGAENQPFAMIWNITGFATVGICLGIFGWTFGSVMNDRLLGTCLAVAGVGFAMAAIPTDFDNTQSPLSKAHYVSLCLSLAGWCLGLARLMNTSPQNSNHHRYASYAVGMALLPIAGTSTQLSGEPLAQRIVLAIVFTWIVLTSLQLLTSSFRLTTTMQTKHSIDANTTGDRQRDIRQ